MPEWAAEMNQTTGSNLYDSGLHDGWWTRTSHWLDKNVFDPVASVTTEPLGEAVGSLFGNEEAGARVGRGLPRALTQTLPLYLAGPEAGIPATIASLGATGGLMAAQTYADTGSGQAAAISGLTGAALPVVGRFGGNLAARAFGVGESVAGETAAGRIVNDTFPVTGSETTFRAAKFGGSQLAMGAANEASMYATDKTLKQPFDPLSPDFLLSQIPFTVFDAVHGLTVKSPTAGEVRGTLRTEVPKETPKDYVLPDSLPAQHAQQEALFERLQVLKDSGTPEEHQAALQAALVGMSDPESVIRAKNTLSEFVKQRGTTEHQPELPVQEKPYEMPLEKELAGLKQVGGEGIVGPVLTDVEGNVLATGKAGEQTHADITKPAVEKLLSTNPESDVTALQHKFLSPDGEVLSREDAWQVAKTNNQIKPESLTAKANEVKPKLESQDLLVHPLRQVAQEVVRTQEGLAATKEKIAKVPETAEEIPTLITSSGPMLHGNVPGLLRVAMKNVEGKVFVGDKDTMNHITLIDKYNLPDTAEFGFVDKQGNFLDRQEAFRAQRDEWNKIALEREVKNGSTATQAVESVRLQTQTPVVDSHLETLNVLKKEAKVISMTGDWVKTGQGGQPQAIYGEAVRDENGENFKTRGLAEAYKEADDKLSNHVVRNAGKDKGFYLAPVINREVSLEGTKLEEVLGEKAIATPVDGRPDVSMNDVLDTLSRVGKKPAIFDEMLDNNDVAQTLQEIRQTREFLQARAEGKDVKATPELMKTVAKVTRATGEWNRQFRNYSLESHVPMNETLVDQIGIRKPDGIRNWLDWFVKHPQRGPMGLLVKALIDHPEVNVDNVMWTYPTHPDYNARDGWMFKPGTKTEAPRISAEWLPSNENEAFAGALKLAHEIGHHAGEAMLDRSDPASVAFRSSLKQILDLLDNNKVIPLKVRNAVKKARAEGWYDDFVNAAPREGGDELYNKFVDATGAEGKGWFDVFYGMQNEHELFGQVFGSRQMVDTLLKTSMPRTKFQTVLHFFSDAFNRLFNGKAESENALYEILSKFENFLGGKSSEGYGGRDYIRDALIAKGVRPEGLASRVDTVNKLFSTGDLTHSIDGYEREAQNGLLPATAETGPLDQNVKTTLVSGKPTEVYQATKGVLMKDVAATQDLYARLKEDVQTTRELINNIKAGTVPGVVSQGVEEALGRSFIKLNRMKEGLDKQTTAIQGFNDLNNFTPGGAERSLIASTFGRMPGVPRDPTGLEDLAHAQLGFTDEESDRTKAARATLKGENGPGFFSRMFKQMQFLKQTYPEFRNVANHADEAAGDMSQRSVELNYARTYNPDLKATDPEISKSIRRVNENPKLNVPASDILRYIQVLEKEGKEWTWNDPYIRERLRGSSDIKTTVNAEVARYAQHLNQMSLHLSKYNQLATGQLIATLERGMAPTQASAVAEELYRALGLLKAPETVALGTDTLRTLATKMQPDTFNKALQFSYGLIQDAEKTLTTMKAHPTYVSEVRYDKNQLRMVGPKGEPYLAGFDNVKAANAEMQRKEAQGWKLLDFVKRTDANAPNTGVSEEMMSTLQEMDLQHENRLRQALGGMDPTLLAQILPATQRAAEYRLTLMGSTPLPGSVGARERKFVAGRENLNMLKNADTYYRTTNNWMRNRELRAQTDLDMLEPALQNNRVLKTQAEKYVAEQLAPDNELVRKINEATYNWRLAWNFGVNFLHGIQSLTIGMSAAIAETGSVGDAFALTTKAMNEIIQRRRTGQWSNEGYRFLNDRMVARGEKGIATYDSFVDQDRAAVYDSNNILGKATGAIDTVKFAARRWTNWFARANDTIGSIVGWDLAKSRGMGDEAAYRFAKDMKDRGYFSPGKAGRSIGLWDTSNKAVPQLMSSLNTYTLSWFSMLSNNWELGFGKSPIEMTTQQRLGARKAFIYQLGAQAVLAGAIGLPGVGQGMALLRQTTGLDLKSWLRAHLADFFDEDQANGGIVTNLALHGAVAAFTPMDPSGRHIPNFPFLGVSPSTGFDAKNLLPAPIATASDFVLGLMAAAKGDMQGVQKALPHVLQGPLQLMQGNGDVRDKRGGLLYQMSPSERFISALGMTPSKVAESRDVATAVKDAGDAANKLKSDFIDSVAQAYRTNGPSSGQKLLVEFLASHPEEDGRSLVAAVSHRVEAQTFLADPMRGVNPGADLTGLSRTTPSNEEGRLNLRTRVTNDLGVRFRPSIQSQRQAQTVDSLVNSDPYGLGRAEALKQAQVLMRVPHRSNVLSFPESPQLPQAVGY